MEASIPIGFILNPVKTWLSKFFFYETYRTSHEHYLKNNDFLSVWHDLTPDIQVSTYHASILDNESPALSKIAIRSTSIDSFIDTIEVVVEAKTSYGKYQDRISAYNISEVPTILTMPSIPLRNIIFLEGNCIHFSYYKFSIYLLKPIYTLSGQVETKLYNTNCEFSLSNDDLLNQRFVRKWDKNWNVSEIDYTIEYYKAFLNYYLVQSHHYHSTGYKIPLKSKVRYCFTRSLGRVIYYSLSMSWVLKIFFWLPILLKLKKFKVKH